ncbi:MAG: hypothetical protein Kilf2KO_25130 [Rhodospirillales bacterium]
MAVALSGGGDSLALTLLLRDWALARGGQVTALIVDHGLRRESGLEAAATARVAQDLGLAAQILVWEEEPPRSGLQASARAARYRLLCRACRDLGLLYLALGHHRDDQAETLLLRAESGSGPLGLAAMSRLKVLPEVLLLRPLLQEPKAVLLDSLRRRALQWVEDPTNRDRRHKRVALRALRPQLRAQGLTAPALAEATRSLGATRRALELEALTWLAGASRWLPLGYVSLDRDALVKAPPLLAALALAVVLRAVGGRSFAPPLPAVAALLGRLGAKGGGPTTLGGCRLLRRGGTLLAVREEQGTTSLDLRPGAAGLWDRRFRVALSPAAPDGLRLGILTRRRWEALGLRRGGGEVPPPVFWSMPCIFDRDGPLALPLVAWVRPESGVEELLESEPQTLSLHFAPADLPGCALFTVA